MAMTASRRRVGFFFNHAAIIGGGEISFIDLADTIRGYGVTPVVFVPGRGEVYERLSARGMRPHRFFLPRIRWYTLPLLPLATASIVWALMRHGVTILHANGARCMLLAGAAALFCRIPVVWHVRVMGREAALDRLRSRLAKVIIANSRAVAQTLQPITDVDAAVRVVHNGIDYREFAATPPIDLYREFSLPNIPVVLAVGRLCACKGLHVLIEACGILKGVGPAFTCLIIGQDALYEREYGRRLREMPVRSGLDNVVFGSWRNDVPSIMKSAAVLALPSDSESFGRVVIEAWACGLPVVATESGGPAEIIDEGETGLFVPVNAPQPLALKIALLLTDRKLHDRLAANGLLRVKDFSLDAHARNIAAVYQELMEHVTRAYKDDGQVKKRGTA
ncbi:MAG: glycosyltransferase family 4 protein [Chitinispirillaceae bacterium]|nr:glycosyltransferase family 4 protein [Chitinispirillaceae bacterium]